MATSHLARIAYASAIHAEFPRGDLDAMLSAWRRRNAGRGVTGFFLYHRASVFQVIEGFPDVIAELFAAIASDPQHYYVAKLIDEPITERGFGDWSMGHARIDEPSALGPMVPASGAEFRYWQCNEDAARGLVGAFAAGPWRRSIS